MTGARERERQNNRSCGILCSSLLLEKIQVRSKFKQLQPTQKSFIPNFWKWLWCDQSSESNSQDTEKALAIDLLFSIIVSPTLIVLIDYCTTTYVIDDCKLFSWLNFTPCRIRWVGSWSTGTVGSSRSSYSRGTYWFLRAYQYVWNIRWNATVVTFSPLERNWVSMWQFTILPLFRKKNPLWDFVYICATWIYDILFSIGL
jgi:hypothetical protein